MIGMAGWKVAVYSISLALNLFNNVIHFMNRHSNSRYEFQISINFLINNPHPNMVYEKEYHRKSAHKLKLIKH